MTHENDVGPTTGPGTATGEGVGALTAPWASRGAEAAAAADLKKARASALWPLAVLFARDLLGKDGAARIRKRYRANPTRWYLPLHLGSGLGVRNRLRDGGFGEAEFAIGNLDNVYAAILEEAAGLGSG